MVTFSASKQRVLRGLIPGEDAPDIVANTFLDQVTTQQLEDIGLSFLEHRERRSVFVIVKPADAAISISVKMAINGHLAWTCQNASGNRGDDIRSLRLSELQPYQFLHPNLETSVCCVLGLQGEEKAGRRGMKTVGVYFLCAFVSFTFTYHSALAPPCRQ